MACRSSIFLLASRPSPDVDVDRHTFEKGGRPTVLLQISMTDWKLKFLDQKFSKLLGADRQSVIHETGQIIRGNTFFEETLKG